jgi:hypothetical protein
MVSSRPIGANMPPLTLIYAIIESIVIPEIGKLLRDRQNQANGTTPTDAEIIAALKANTALGISIGEAWIAAHETK